MIALVRCLWDLMSMRAEFPFVSGRLRHETAIFSFPTVGFR